MSFKKIDIGTGEEVKEDKPGNQPEYPEYDYPTPGTQIVPHTPTKKEPEIPPSMLPFEAPKKPQEPEKEWVNQVRVNIGDQLDK